jgi:predicted nucleic acid-binding protein
MGSRFRLQVRALSVVNVLVDTSVWSLAMRRSATAAAPQVALLDRCLERQDVIVTTGLVVQELLQGFYGPKQRTRILKEFRVLPLIMPDLEDHVEAADLRNHCRRHGVQVGTIDALLARLAIRYGLALLTSDRDFEAMAKHVPLSLLTA